MFLGVRLDFIFAVNIPIRYKLPGRRLRSAAMRSGGVQRHILHRRRAVTSLTQNLDLITGSHGIQAVFFFIIIP